MAWVATEKDGTECIFENKPYKNDEEWEDADYVFHGGMYYEKHSKIRLPNGTIKKLIGRDLTWEDNTVELREE